MDGNLTRLNKYKYGIQKFRLHDVKSNMWIYGPTVIFYILFLIIISFRQKRKRSHIKFCSKKNRSYCGFFIKYFILLTALLLLLIYLIVRFTNCSHLKSSPVTIAEAISIPAIRNCIFNSPPPWSAWNPHKYGNHVSARGVSNYFTTLETPDYLERVKVMQFNIHKSLYLYITNGGITLKQVRTAQKLQGWWGSGRVRIQIINGKLYVIFPPWLHRLEPRHIYTIMQILDVLHMYKNRVPDVNFVINTSGM